jgi:hypothetical protein
MEMMICVASRYLEDGKTVAVGTGAPCAAAMLAQKTQSPNLVILFEAGGISPLLPQMPISVGDSRTFFRAVMAAGMTEMMTTCSRGLVDYAFLGGAQIDKYGNINSTVVGDYYKPKVRFPAANDSGVNLAQEWFEQAQFHGSPATLSGRRRVEAAPQSAINVCRRFRLKAKHTNPHSPAAATRPRRENWRKPRTSLMMPMTGSTVHFRKR